MNKYLISGLLVTFLIFLVISILTFFGILESLKFYALTLLLINFLILIYFKFRSNFIKFLAFAVPLIILLFVLYINFLPFGYSKDYTISIDENGNIHSSSSRFYLEDMKGNKITNLTDVYDYGSINAVIKPSVVLRNANIEASITGDDVYFASTDFNPDKYDWDYFWDFTKGIPSPLKGTAKYDSEKECVYFNASNKETLYYPNSKDMFESGPFIVYAEWMPENKETNNTFQQIIGHYNWEVLQEKEGIRFLTGRMINSTGPQFSIKKKGSSSIETKQSALAIYNPSEKGYVEFWVNNEFIGRIVIKDNTLWNGYNGERNLTFGKSGHGTANYYQGCIINAGFDYGKIEYDKDINMPANDKLIKIPVLGTGKPENIKINVRK